MECNIEELVSKVVSCYPKSEKSIHLEFIDSLTIKELFARPDPSVLPSSRRSAYGVRSTVPAPSPRHRLSNKRVGCGNEKSWLSIHQRPCLFIQQPHGVRGFNARSTVATPGITRGQQVRSFADAQGCCTARRWSRPVAADFI